MEKDLHLLRKKEINNINSEPKEAEQIIKIKKRRITTNKKRKA